VIHLDTSFLVDLLREQRRRKPGAATAALDALADEELAVSLFVLCELEAGAAGSDRPEQERARILGLLAPLELVMPAPSLAPIYGRLLAELEQRGEAIATMDLLIAATALADAAPLVTGNRRHFERIAGLEVISY
jgi:predicted nucleic acid-binding protein